MWNQNLFPTRTKNWHNSTTGKKVPPAHAQRVFRFCPRSNRTIKCIVNSFAERCISLCCNFIQSAIKAFPYRRCSSTVRVKNYLELTTQKGRIYYSLVLLQDLARWVHGFSCATWVSSCNPGRAKNARPYMYIGTYCQYVEEKGCCSCKKRQEPKSLALPPFLRVVLV